MKNHALIVAIAVALGVLTPVSAAHAADSAVSGRITLGGVAVSGTEVGWFDPTTGAAGETVSAADGSYSLVVGDGHPYVVYAGIDHATTGRWLPLGGDRFTGAFVGASGTDYLYQSIIPFTAAATVDVALTAPGSIAGKARGLAGERVQLRTLADNVVAKVRATSTGRYAFTGLIPGRYRLTAFGALDSYDEYTSAIVVVSAGRPTVLNPQLVKTGRVSGVVRMHGQPVKGVIVSVANAGTENGTATDARGHYAIEHVPTGKATLYFSGQGTKPTGDYGYRGYQKHVSVRVKAGASRRLDVAIPRPGLLTGSITPTAGAKNFTVRLVDAKGRPAVQHYVKVGSKKSAIPLALPGIRAGRYTVVITDSKATRYAKRKVTLRYGKTASIGALSLTKKTVTLSGSISGAVPYYVSFENRYGQGQDLHFAGHRYRITGLVPGRGTVRVSWGGRAGPKPYFTADRYYSLALTKSTTLDVANGGPQIGVFTGTLAVGSLPIATAAYLSGTSRPVPLDPVESNYNNADVIRGAINGSAETDGATTYTLGSQYNGWPKEFVQGAPFWLDLPTGSISVTAHRGTTVDIGTIQLVPRR